MEKPKCEYCHISLATVDENGVVYIKAVHYSPTGVAIYAQGEGYITPFVLFCSPECRDIWLNTR